MMYQVPAVLCVGSLLTAVALAFQPSPGGPAAAVFPPWWDAARSVSAAAASGPILRLGGAPFIVVVASTLSGPPKGAWLMLNPVVLGGCAFNPAQREPFR